jgi:hypothetical protein
MTFILALAFFASAGSAQAAPTQKAVKPAAVNSAAKSDEGLEASLEAAKAAAAEERTQTRALFMQEKVATAEVQADKSRSDAVKEKAIRQIKKDFVARRNAVRLRVRMQFRRRYIETGDGRPAAGGLR